MDNNFKILFGRALPYILTCNKGGFYGVHGGSTVLTVWSGDFFVKDDVYLRI